MSHIPAQTSNNKEGDEDQKMVVYVVVVRREGWGWEAWQAPPFTEEIISIHNSSRGANDAAITHYKEKVLPDDAGDRYVASANCFVNGLFREIQDRRQTGVYETVVEVREITVND